jgi:hypothetical protein
MHALWARPGKVGGEGTVQTSLLVAAYIQGSASPAPFSYRMQRERIRCVDQAVWMDVAFRRLDASLS